MSKMFSYSSCGATSPSCDARRELDEVVVKYFLCVDYFGFTRPIQVTAVALVPQ